MHCSMGTIKAAVLQLQQQTNGIDCGLYALAFIVYLLENNKYGTEVSGGGFAPPQYFFQK